MGHGFEYDFARQLKSGIINPDFVNRECDALGCVMNLYELVTKDVDLGDLVI